LITENGIDIGTDDQKYISNLITNEHAPRKNEKAFLYDIVSNKRNSVDVDKFDYLRRDSLYALGPGSESSFNYERLMNFSRVVDNQICFHRKEAPTLYKMFQNRYDLHSTVYTEPKGKCIEYMICDALQAADDVLQISTSIEHPEEFVKLTDSILDTIMRSNDKKLQEAQKIIKRIRKRQLYKFCAEILVPQNRMNDCRNVTVRDIVTAAPNLNLCEEDIIIHNCKLSYAMKDKDPVRYVKFFNEWDGPVFEVPKQEISLLIPDQFEELRVRVFARDPEKEAQVSEAFSTWCQGLRLNQNNISSVVEADFEEHSNKRKRTR